MSLIAGLPPGITFEPRMLDALDCVMGKSPSKIALDYFDHQKKYPVVLIKDEESELMQTYCNPTGLNSKLAVLNGEKFAR